YSSLARRRRHRPRAVLANAALMPLLNSFGVRTISGARTETPSGFGSITSLFEDMKMTRMTTFSSPLLLGFDAMEKTLERIAKSADGYPPYNIERIRSADGSVERLRITLAV